MQIDLELRHYFGSTRYSNYKPSKEETYIRIAFLWGRNPEKKRENGTQGSHFDFFFKIKIKTRKKNSLEFPPFN